VTAQIEGVGREAAHDELLGRPLEEPAVRLEAVHEDDDGAGRGRGKPGSDEDLETAFALERFLGHLFVLGSGPSKVITGVIESS
jgi:hypothetical protein